MAYGEGEEHLDGGGRVRRGIVRVADVDPVVRAQIDECAPSLAVRIEVAVDHHGVEHGPAPSLFHQAPTRRDPGPEHVEDRQVVVQLHAHERNPSPSGREHGVGDKRDRRTERHALGASLHRRDAVHRGRVERNVPAGVDEARPAAHRHAVDDRDERIGHGHVAEAVNARRLEVETEYLPLGPISHPGEHGSTM